MEKETVKTILGALMGEIGYHELKKKEGSEALKAMKPEEAFIAGLKQAYFVIEKGAEYTED